MVKIAYSLEKYSNVKLDAHKSILESLSKFKLSTLKQQDLIMLLTYASKVNVSSINGILDALTKSKQNLSPINLAKICRVLSQVNHKNRDTW